jgi:nucleotide-binding universal stress UspA family protein
MSSIQTVLHATDFSPCSDFALQVAGALARDYGARLVILHVGSVPLQHLGGAQSVPPSEAELGRDDLENQLRQRLVPNLTKGPEYRLEYAESASDEILRIADEIRCDLIVLGTHGRTGVSRLLMGSVAEQIVRRAKCPVLTVRLRSSLGGEDRG